MKRFWKSFLLILVLISTVISLEAQVTIDDITSTNTICGGDSTGTLTVNISGGTGPYNYTLFRGATPVTSSGITDSTHYTFTGLIKSFLYLVIVEDGDPLIIGFDSDNATVNGPNPISILTYNATDITCNPVDDGTIAVAALGEGGNYIFDLAGPAPQSNEVGIFEDLPEGIGNYQVTVRDKDGCPLTASTPMLTINRPTPVTVTPGTVTHVDCFGDNTGAIPITPGGGTGSGYTYEWTGPSGPFATSQNVTDLEAGSYSVTVFDGNLCPAFSGPILVNQETEIDASRDYFTDVSCNGGNDGTSRVTAMGGVGGYTYSWDGQSVGFISDAVDPSNLPADTYDLTVFDSNGCSRIFSSFVTITEPDPLGIVVDGVFDATCFGNSDGSAITSPSGGSGSYTYSWTGTIPVPAYSSPDKDPDGMPKDVYSLLLSDDNGCSQLFPDLVTIDEPDLLTAVATDSSMVSCFDGNDGTATLMISGGTSPYDVTWSGDITGYTSDGASPIDLVADTYDVLIVDDNLCSRTFFDLVNITQPDELDVLVENVTHVNCNGEPTGAIDILPLGGTPVISFEWSGPGGPAGTTQNIANLAAGAYSVILTDANLCTKEFLDVATVNEVTGISATFDLSHISCDGGSDGAIDASVSGGNPDYTYDWTGPGAPHPQTEDLFGLAPGFYQLTVTDDSGCVEIMPVQELTDPPPISASAIPVDVDCFGNANGSIDLTVSGGTPGYTFAWTGPLGPAGVTEDLTGQDTGQYSVTITDTEFCSEVFTDIAYIQQPDELMVTSLKSDISCGGEIDGAIDITISGGVEPYIITWSGPGSYSNDIQDISGLAKGQYSLNVIDANGCELDLPNLEEIIEPELIVATYDSHEDILCNGGNNGTIDISITGGTAPLNFDWTDSLGITQSNIQNPVGLEAGRYSLTITDDNGCSASFPDLATITEPTALSATLANTNIVCYGDGNGSITVTAAGGNPNYEYSRLGDSDPDYQAGVSFSGLDPGFYTIWTRDANKCVVTDTVTIQEPEEIQILGETRSGQNLCYGDSSAQISIDVVTGGVLPYEYSINGGTDFFATSLFLNLPAGSYQTVVQDASGCTAPGNLNNITQPSMMWIETYNQTNITSCYNALEGGIFIVAKGGNGTKSYTLNDTLINPSGNFQNLPGGLHKITITDDNGCSRDTSSIITTPPELLFDVITINNVIGCPGDATASVAPTGSGGIPPYTFSINGGPFGSGPFAGLTAGNYTLTIEDSSIGGCTRDSVITVTEPAPIAILSELITHITCAGDSNGIIEIVAIGGTPDLSYTLNPGGITNDSGIFTGLAPDIAFTVSVEDSENCGPVDSNPITIIDPPELLIDSVLSTAISCNGSADGTIEIIASGGVPPYLYSVDDQATWLTDSAFAGLTPDTFEVFVMDANLCMIGSDTIILTDPPLISVSVTPTHITTCSGDTTGAIEAVATGGTGFLEYSLDGVLFQPTGIFNNLPGGDTTVYIRDSTGCMVTEPVTINEPVPVTASVSKTDAVFGNLGTITITAASGGTPPYLYTADSTVFPLTSDTAYTDLEAGIYNIIVMDATGCTYEETITILDVVPLNVLLNVTQVTCFSDDDGTIEFLPQDAEGAVLYSIDSGMNFVPDALFENLPGDTTYYLVARDTAGKVFTGSTAISEPAEITLSENITAAECNAFSETGAIDITVSGGSGDYSYIWSDGSIDEDRLNIVAGDYSVEITDSAGCVLNESMIVGSQVIVTANAGTDTTICFGESVQLQGAGGNNTPSWSPVTFLSDPDTINPLAVGVTETTTYILTVTEESSIYGCFATDSVTITTFPLVGIEVTEDTFIVKGTSLQLEAAGGPFQAYRWEPETGLDNSTIATPVASPQQSIRYTVYGTNDIGCEESDSVYIEVIEDIQAFNVFSPNSDGINDFFDIENASRFPEMIVEVYSRWGDMIFSTVGYDDGSRWDGTTRGKDAPVGTYYYILIPYSGADPITGNVTIIR